MSASPSSGAIQRRRRQSAEDQPTEASPPTPKRRATPPTASTPPDTSLLPYPYQHVLSYFPRVYALASLFWHRGSVCTFESIRSTLGEKFNFTHLRQMIFLAPDMLQFQPILLSYDFEDDPFAPSKSKKLRDLPIEGRYELLNTELIEARKKEKHSTHVATNSRGVRNTIARPRLPKPTQSAMVAANTRFQCRVVEYFARPDATMQIPECQLPTIEEMRDEGDDDDDAARAIGLPAHAKLRDDMTVADNSDATTRPRRDYPTHREPKSDEEMKDEDVQLIERAHVIDPTSIASSSASSSSSSPDSSLFSSPLLPNLVTHLRQQRSFYQAQIEYVHHTPARAAIKVEIRQIEDPRRMSEVQTNESDSNPLNLAPDMEAIYLSSPLVRCLRSHSPPLSHLFLHQAQAVDCLLTLRRRVVVISTPTSSGKSLCYTLPLAESILNDPHTHAFAIFPTKALAQDQLNGLRQFMSRLLVGSGRTIEIDTYDGDTPIGARSIIRDRCSVILTNPDMLHQSILPFHHDFSNWFKHLKFLIIDESHVYRSTFGSHMCLILRRIRRICKFYGSSPQFIFCSATMSSPRQFIGTLLGYPERDVTLINEDTSERGEKQWILWNTPIMKKDQATTASASAASSTQVSPAQSHKRKYQFSTFFELQSNNSRRSVLMESAILLANLVQINYRTICFCGSRKAVEVVTDLTRRILSSTPSTAPLVELVKGYRGGYSAHDRRDIERAMFNGSLRGIVSTNALELGIDIGSLDVTMHIGLPPTMANLIQQSGRSGRGGRPSLSILLAHDSPLDQFYMSQPMKLFTRQAESCIVDFENPDLIEAHLMCAAVEIPIQPHADQLLFGREFQHIFERLVSDKMWLVRRPVDPHHPSPFDSHPSYDLLNGVWENEFRLKHQHDSSCHRIDFGPSGCFSIRNMSQRMIRVIDMTNSIIIDESDEGRAMFGLHTGAIYSNQGKEYVVQSFELELGQVKVKPIRQHTYYTKCLDHTHIVILSRTHAFSPSAQIQVNPTEEQTDHVPPSISATLASIHTALTASSAHRLPSDSLLLQPYLPLQQWYLKAEHSSPDRWVDLCAYGRVRVSTHVYGFRKISKVTHRQLERLTITMPPYQLETFGCWIDLPKYIKQQYQQWSKEQIKIELDTKDRKIDQPTKKVKRDVSVEPSSSHAAASSSNSALCCDHTPDDAEIDSCVGRPIHAAIHGLTHCMIALMPMYLLCDGSADLYCDCPSVYDANYAHRESRGYRILLYHRIGSTGSTFMREAARVMHRLVSHARDVIQACTCVGVQGCPTCVQSSRCKEYNEVTDKAGALWLATALEQWSRENEIRG